MFNIASLLSISSLLVYSPYTSATACEEMINSLYGGVCKDVDGTCPKSCIDDIIKTHDACKGGSVLDENNKEVPYNILRIVLLGSDDKPNVNHFNFYRSDNEFFGRQFSENCSKDIFDWLISSKDVSCHDFFMLNGYSGAIVCSNDEQVCSDECKGIIKKFHYLCKADDSLEDPYGSNTTMTAKALEEEISQFRHPDCNEYSDTLEFEGKGGDASIASTMFTANIIANVVVLLSGMFSFTLAM